MNEHERRECGVGEGGKEKVPPTHPGLVGFVLFLCVSVLCGVVVGSSSSSGVGEGGVFFV